MGHCSPRAKVNIIFRTHINYVFPNGQPLNLIREQSKTRIHHMLLSGAAWNISVCLHSLDRDLMYRYLNKY